MKLTYEIARAAGQDAANRNMRKNHRKKWNQADYNISVREFNRLWPVSREIRAYLAESDTP